MQPLGLCGISEPRLTVEAQPKLTTDGPRPANNDGSYGVQWKISAGRILKNWKPSLTEPKVDLR